MVVTRKRIGILLAGLLLILALIVSPTFVPANTPVLGASEAHAVAMYVKNDGLYDPQRMTFRDGTGSSWYVYPGQSLRMSNGGRQVWCKGYANTFKDGNYFCGSQNGPGYWKGFSWQPTLANFSVDD